ncbi:NnrS family protein [Ramlibacter ginsenosidimutans]|uniref:NnrS family protein n=1 Tax=Ramlibacter ginsenosidimutans TaxID=502333 RepID=A0A934TRC4_9BURK|nr:NnrS family protein [Ramlibacter ginsenosidimutans]MBK6006101.1 NnrS family protein [Ramlibacter ginsenosidimutans]
MKQILQIQQPPRSAAPRGFALWQLGFRPFYLLASVFAAGSILLWALQFTGHLAAPYLPGPLWHAHEMLFGFALAVVVGFLFTAGQAWTGQPTPTGGRLAALAALWFAARVLVLTPWGWASALANTAFPLAAAAALAVPFVRAGNRRNYFFIALLVLLGLASLAVHLGQLGVLALPAWAAIQVALDVMLFILCVMGGRVIPMFTNNGVPGAGAQRRAWIEKLALGSVLALLAADALQAPAWLVLAIAALAAIAHLARWLLWHPWTTVHTPLVWVLHLAYAWIPVHLALRACAAAGVLPASAATHALTVGAIGGLVIGMMTRTARGHTARPLRADRWDTAAYLLVAAAAVARVLVPLALPSALLTAVLCSALLWSAGFALYAVRYFGVLTRPRLDGKPG